MIQSPWRVSSRTKLSQLPTKADALYESDDHYEDLLKKTRGKIAKRQEILFGDGRFTLLVIFQGMDTSGKDGAIKHVMSCLNPQGVTVISFGPPSEDESRHDFLWRAHQRVPPRGKVAIFNRSHYEEVLAPRVHPEFLEKQRLPPGREDFWKNRCRDIASFESYLDRQGYKVIKFFLHLSKGEQKKRLLDRIEKPEKNWKFDVNDIKARKLWSRYQRAYEECLNLTSTREAPWYAIPADDKKNARLMISDLVLAHLEELPLQYPRVSPEKRRELQKIKRQLLESR